MSIIADHNGAVLRSRANAALRQWTYMHETTIKIGEANIPVEVEYWWSTTADEGVVAAVRTFEAAPRAGSRGFRKRYLPSPNWLLEILCEQIDTTKLPHPEVGDPL